MERKQRKKKARFLWKKRVECDHTGPSYFAW